MKDSHKQAQLLLSIDYGMARVGMALSDTSHILASPLPHLMGSQKMEQTVRLVIDTIQALEKERECTIVEVVVGLPLMMSGKQGLMADEVHAFVAALKEAGSCPVVTWDERLTSVQAERSMRDGGVNRKKRAKNVDSLSAVIILQSYMDHKRFQI